MAERLDLKKLPDGKFDEVAVRVVMENQRRLMEEWAKSEQTKEDAKASLLRQFLFMGA